MQASGFLEIHSDGSYCSTNSYLLRSAVINEKLKALPGDKIPDPESCPNRRKGFESQAASARMPKGEDDASFGTYADDASARMPTCFGTYADLKGTLKGNIEIKELPIIPLRENLEHELIVEPIEPTEAGEENLQLTVDTNLEQVHTLWRVNTGQELRMMGKTQRKLSEAIATRGMRRIQSDLEGFAEEGGRSIDKFVARYKSSGMRRPMRREAVTEPVDFFSRPTMHRSSRQDVTPVAPAIPEFDHAPWTSRWNELVPAAPVAWKGSVSAIERASLDADFRTQFDKICAKAQAIHVAKGAEASWLTFRWLLADKDGNPNWNRLLSGELDFMVAPKQSRVADSSIGLGARLLAKRKAEREAREKADAQV
jgi:hypothetical protein